MGRSAGSAAEVDDVLSEERPITITSLTVVVVGIVGTEKDTLRGTSPRRESCMNGAIEHGTSALASDLQTTPRKWFGEGLHVVLVCTRGEVTPGPTKVAVLSPGRQPDVNNLTRPEDAAQFMVHSLHQLLFGECGHLQRSSSSSEAFQDLVRPTLEVTSNAHGQDLVLAHDPSGDVGAQLRLIGRVRQLHQQLRDVPHLQPRQRS
mmetsp:Transcript_22125/g.48363  ORF Transcript_22125/g.48363 Transcript_22125/m.48363 type:complete len:205 (-) Transcript_22125:1423-2037(-)